MQGEGCCYNASIDNGYSNMKQYVIADKYADTTYTSGISSVKGQLVPANEPLYDGGDNRANIIGGLVALGKGFTQTLSNQSQEVVLVQAAVAGTLISDWLAAGGKMLMQRAIYASNNASNLLPNATIAMITYVQGEQDAQAGTNRTTYENELIQQFIPLLRSVHGATSITPFLIGSMVPEWVASRPNSAGGIEDVHRAIPSLVPYTAYHNMPFGYVDCVEAIHFSATGQRMAGQMFLRSYARALANTHAGMVPNHPSGLAVRWNAGTTTVTLSWTAPSTVSTAAITDYGISVAQYFNTSNPGGSCLDTNPAAPVLFLVGSSTATSYSISAASLPATGSSTWQFDVSAISNTQWSSARYSSWVLSKPVA